MNSDLLTVEPETMLVGGNWIHSKDGQVLQSLNPATGQRVGSMARGSRSEVALAVQAATASQGAWADLDATARADYLYEIARRIRAASERLATVEALDAGIPIRNARTDITAGANWLEYAAGLAQETKGVTVPTSPQRFHYSIRQPYGVIAILNPFNHPAMFALSKVAAPLAAGNTVVMKPPEQASLSTLEIAAIMQEVLPEGVVNVITGLGAEAGAALVAHKGVSKISFTGSLKTGRRILVTASRRVTPVKLNAGGKGANIVLPDCDLDLAVAGAVSGMSLGFCGQSCQSGTRLFLHESIRAVFVDKLVERLEKVQIGMPVDPTTQMGPIVSKAQLDRVLGYIESGRQEGGTLVFGGDRPTETMLSDGYFVRPTVFDGVTAKMKIGREEIFGPVLSIFSWRDQDKMLQQVNGLGYGLTASVWTATLEAHRIARRIDAGYVYVNQHGGSYRGLPFGGWKQSGIGVEHTPEELLEYSRPKSVAVLL
jgi:betaine-aldehyde dehydrogenase